MKISAISSNEGFNNRNIKFKANYRNIVRTGSKITSKNSCSDSVLLYFAGLLSAFGFNKPLEKLISTLR